jgi:hypothetical protein
MEGGDAVMCEFRFTQNKSRFGENNTGLKQKNSRLPIPRECVDKHLIRNEIFDRFAVDNSRNCKYFPSNRELLIPAASSDEATGAVL